MKKRLFSQPIEQQRADIRARLDMYRLSQKPTCHIVLPDDDYQVMRGDSLDAYTLDRELSAADLMLLIDVPAYEIAYGLKLVPLSQRGVHCATVCTRDVAGVVAA